MIAYFQDQVENVLSDLDSALHDDPILKLMLMTLRRENKMEGFINVMPSDLYEAKVKDLYLYIFEKMEGLNFFFQEFNYDKYLDFLSLVQGTISREHLDTILVMLIEKTKKKSAEKTFFEGRRPNMDDVTLLVRLIEGKGETT